MLQSATDVVLATLLSISLSLSSSERPALSQEMKASTLENLPKQVLGNVLVTSDNSLVCRHHKVRHGAEPNGEFSGVM